ncbi:MerR family transcriptional regulator [Streptomyces sp. NRRL B-24484]|uniref:MerR family transcriptional regulator n=1 Tax=Streptomyces sp. NRRL B-24484 TaxID=1463833 RepID=UPI0007C4C126|nr:MerR family transcriptional regulator [Streptomyces sp. NRRL B-24484]
MEIPTDLTASLAEASITTGGVARRLGVSPTTVRSWERRYGIGPSGHEAGRHRRWRPQDVAVLEAMCRLTAHGVPPAEAARLALAGALVRVPQGRAEARAAGGPGEAREPGEPRESGGSRALPLGTVRPECRGLGRAAVRLDAPVVERMLDRVVADLGVVTAWDEVMMPALRAVGRKWAVEGERYVEVEHLLSWHVSGALRKVTRCVDPAAPTAPVLLAGMPGELHSLALEAAAAGLSERGVPYRMFGPAVPTAALVEAVRRIGPSAALLWSQCRSTADPRLAQLAAATAWGPRGARARPAVLLGGPGWAGVGRIAGTVRPRRLPEGLAQLEALAAA